MEIKKSLLIQLFDSSGMKSERLVQQAPEFTIGPKEKHTGVFRIQFTLETKNEIEGAIDYLKKLALDAPLKETGVRGRTPLSKTNNTLDNSFEILLEDAKKAANGNQDKFIDYLRGLDFVFLSSDNLKLKIPKTYKVKQKHLDKYQWLIKRSRKAKDPRNDRYDPQLFIGISIFGGRDRKMVVYLYNKLSKSLFIDVPSKKAIDYTKTNLIKYPHYMNEEERLKWGIEHRILLNNPEKKPSKFYLRWVKDVNVGDELKLNLNGEQSSD